MTGPTPPPAVERGEGARKLYMLVFSIYIKLLLEKVSSTIRLLSPWSIPVFLSVGVLLICRFIPCFNEAWSLPTPVPSILVSSGKREQSSSYKNELLTAWKSGYELLTAWKPHPHHAVKVRIGGSNVHRVRIGGSNVHRVRIGECSTYPY